MEAWKHFRAVLLLPGIVLVLIPATIVYRNGTDSFGLWQAMPAIRIVLALLGLGCVAAGLVLMFLTIRLFVTVGQGTLAPWDPTQQLVVRGVYRHVRNPMIAGVCSILLGESLVAASAPLFGWFLILLTVNMIYIPLVEERGLLKRFGDEYEVYKQNVPRWIPRRTPWEQARLRRAQVKC